MLIGLVSHNKHYFTDCTRTNMTDTITTFYTHTIHEVFTYYFITKNVDLYNWLYVFYLRFKWYLFIEHEYIRIFLAAFKSILAYAIFNKVFGNT
jgi:hypothetical protein